jgi:hypothetical protein
MLFSPVGQFPVQYGFQGFDSLFQALRKEPHVLEHLFVATGYLARLFPLGNEMQNDEKRGGYRQKYDYRNSQ